MYENEKKFAFENATEIQRRTSLGNHSWSLEIPPHLDAVIVQKYIKEYLKAPSGVRGRAAKRFIEEIRRKSSE